MGKEMKKRQSKTDMNESTSLYRDIVAATNTLIWRTDGEGRFTFLNPAWERKYGYKNETMLGRPFSEFLLSEAAEHYISAFRNCLIGETITGLETALVTQQGEEVFLAINMIPLFDSKNVITGTQGTAFDISERKHADELLQYISAKDELTGLYNLHTFLSMTEHQIKTASREKKELLIIYTGIDGMQAINDEYGREIGDVVLIDTASILKKTFREADILARTGGDEFVISTLVPERKTEDMIIARLIENIVHYNKEKTDALKLSLSFGTAFHNPEEAGSIEDVLSKADEQMHRNKERKKD